MKTKKILTTLGALGLSLTLISGCVKQKNIPPAQKINDSQTPELFGPKQPDAYSTPDTKPKQSDIFGNESKYSIMKNTEEWTIKSKTQKIDEHEQFTQIAYEIILNMPDMSPEPIPFQGNIILFGKKDGNKLELQSISHYQHSAKRDLIPEGKVILTPEIKLMATNALNKIDQLGDNHEYNTPLITDLVDKIYEIRQTEL